MCLFIISERDKISPISDAHQELNELREKYSKSQFLIQTLQRELAEQKRKERDNVEKNVQEILSSVFTPGQIKMLMKPSQTKTHWSSQDIAAAISLRSVSPKAYVYLRKARNIPLPGMSTLRRWAAAFDLTEGILKNVLQVMKYKGQAMSEAERMTVLCFDEVHLMEQIAIERKEERAIGPNKRCQVVVARGLFKKWKQPIYYKFDQNMTENIILDIIQELYRNGYIVVALTCDLGPTNQIALKNLKIDFDLNGDKTYFQHPCDATKRVHVFADVPHLIKLLRNHLLDSGLRVNGRFINKSCLERLLEVNTNDLKIAHKLTRLHLDAIGSQRQNVKLATQLFSNTNAAAIEWCGLNGYMKDCLTWSETARFLSLINKWFDLFNSVCKFGNHEGLHAYGTNLKKQNAILNEVTEVIKNLRVGKRNSLLPFQKGILLSNASLMRLYEDVTNQNKDITYIMTNRLNQDVIENLFAYIRAMGGCFDHPTPLQFKYRLRWYVLGKYSSDVFTNNSNTNIQDTDDETCLTSDINFDNEVNEVREENEGDTNDTEEMILENIQHFEPSDKDNKKYDDCLEVMDETFEIHNSSGMFNI